ncbi:MAG: FAD-dependent oxidoreductase [Actinomycetota bacterium]|nr:FAD-dependent oxidoreductase [Actinomycetota bacterium]
MLRRLDNSRRVAVVGTGVSGLVCAHELHLAGHEIAVFEADARLGGHSHTVTVETETGPCDVDTGFIVLNDRNYPNLERLLERIGVPTQPAPMTFSVSDGRGDFEWAATLPGVFAKGSHLFDARFHRMLADLVRFNKEARELIGSNGAGGSLRSFCRERGFSDYFVERLIVPQASAVWSADPEQLWNFPISFLAEFLDNHGALQLLGRPKWRSVVGGSRSYVEAISAPWRDRVRLSSPVRAIDRNERGVDVVWEGGRESFDEVIVATHSDQALEMLAEPSRAESEILGAIPYLPNETVLHTDTSLMPRRRRAWASWNFHLMEAAEPGRTTVTYDMNRLQQLAASERFLVTLNRTEAIDPAKIIRRMSYSHPVYTPEGVAAQSRWAEISGHDRVHYCGAYWGWGFHEDGVRSGLRVCEQLGTETRTADEEPEEMALAA